MANQHSDSDAFVLKRMMNQEANERAFEYSVMGQRLYEDEKALVFRRGSEL